MYKNKIKEWGLSKYLTADRAQQILEDQSGTIDLHEQQSAADQEDPVKRAERSLKRKRARERAQTHTQNQPQIQPPEVVTDLHAEPESYTETPVTAVTQAVVPWATAQQSISIPSSLPVSAAGEQFLLNLRKWTHDAFLSGKWDMKGIDKHHSGRQASRSLSSDLTAGTNLYSRGQPDLAWTYWKRAFESFQNPDLFKTWYYETPLRLLFEMGRLAHSGHGPLAAKFLQFIKDWAGKFLDGTDPRRDLFSVFGELDVGELRELYGRAAKSLYNGLESRLEKNDPLLYEVRLNRALDMLWYDADTDLTEWLPPIEEVDKACGENNQYSIYFLLLQAYRLVAKESYTEADDVCAQARDRLAVMVDDPRIDSWRVGLAYRRLGRQQQAKGRYTDARRSFNTALRYVGTGKLSQAILIEICQYQESMAKEMGDVEDATLWNHMLRQFEQQAADQEVAEASQPPKRLLAPEDALTEEDTKRRKLERSPSPRGPSRSNTM